MSDAAPPPWQMPEGVNASLWHYAHSARLAEDEDAYFRDHPLVRPSTHDCCANGSRTPAP